MHQPPPTQQLPTLREKQGESNFFRLPPELRLQVYSYLTLPDAQSLRLTRREINDEIEYEQRKDFVRCMSKIEIELVDAVKITYATPIKPYEANLVIRIVGGSRLKSDDRLKIDVQWLHDILESLPPTTRSINIAIETAPDVVDVSLTDYWFGIVYLELGIRFTRNSTSTRHAIRNGDRHLRSYTMVCTEKNAIPMFRSYFSKYPFRPFHKDKILGIKGVVDKDGSWGLPAVVDGSGLEREVVGLNRGQLVCQNSYA